jgi:hypothetical protein
MWLKKLFKNKRAQSTAEYGILFAAVIAIAAGALTVALRNAIGSKHDKGLEFMLGAGTDTLEQAINDQESQLQIFATQEEVRHTKALAADFKDERVRRKGGAEEAVQTQTTETNQISIDKIVAGNNGS